MPAPARVVRPAAALAAGVVTVLLLVAAAVFSSAAHQFKLSDLGQVALLLSFAVVGVVVAWHQPRNPMGWVVLGVPFFLCVGAYQPCFASRAWRRSPSLTRPSNRAPATATS